MPANKVDILFVIDASESMRPCFQKLRDNLHSFIEPLSNASFQVRFGLLAYSAGRDAKRALQYAQKAASRGSLRGTYILAQCYLRQSLTHPDALQPLTVVAESRPSGELSPEEIAEAQTRLAHLHIFGKSEQCNPRIGVSYATTAMTGGSAEAAYLLGWVYLYGIGVSRDPVFAEAMLQWAHQRGYQKATTMLKKNNWLPNK